MRSWNKAGGTEIEETGEHLVALKKRSLRTLLKILRAMGIEKNIDNCTPIKILKKIKKIIE